MEVVGKVLFVIGSISASIGSIWILMLSRRLGFGWFLSCLLLGPLIWVALLVADFKSTWKPFALAVVGIMIAWGGDSMTENEGLRKRQSRVISPGSIPKVNAPLTE